MTRSNRTPIFNLKAVVHETGIKPDTLRAWERRYGIPAPQRTESGHRLYTQRDIQILKWLLARQAEGLSISRAVALWRKLEKEQGDHLEQAVAQEGQSESTTGAPHQESLNRPSFNGAQYTPFGREGSGQGAGRASKEEARGERLQRLREQWITAAMAFDEQAADDTLAAAFGLFSPEIVCIDLIQKSLAMIGHGWYEGKVTVQQEHFASALAIRRIDSMLSATPPPTRSGRILVGCPPNEAHTFVPLVLTLLLRRRGWNVIYLGADVPVQSLEVTVTTTRPDLVLLTAQQLHTAVGLLEMAKLLTENHIPVCYGGLIFNRLPQLQALIPGYFLGSELQRGIEEVEKIMAAPRPRQAETQVDTVHLKALDHFHERRARIEAELWKRLHNGNLPQRHLTAGNANFGRSIQAALALGDMNYLGADMEWIRGLLYNHNRMPRYLIHEYVSAYRDAAYAHLGENGAPILKWLDMIHTHANDQKHDEDSVSDFPATDTNNLQRN